MRSKSLQHRIAVIAPHLGRCYGLSRVPGGQDRAPIALPPTACSQDRPVAQPSDCARTPGGTLVARSRSIAVTVHWPQCTVPQCPYRNARLDQLIARWDFVRVALLPPFPCAMTTHDVSMLVVSVATTHTHTHTNTNCTQAHARAQQRLSLRLSLNEYHLGST